MWLTVLTIVALAVFALTFSGGRLLSQSWATETVRGRVLRTNSGGEYHRQIMLDCPAGPLSRVYTIYFPVEQEIPKLGQEIEVTFQERRNVRWGSEQRRFALRWNHQFKLKATA